MLIRLRNIFFVVTCTALIAACSRGGSGGSADDGPHVINDNDVVPPVVEITTPTEGQVFANGNSINMTGKITDDNGLYRGSIRITNDADGSIIKEQSYEIHGFLLYNFSLSHTVSVTTAADYTVKVSFEDHGQNVSSKTVKVKVNP